MLKTLHKDMEIFNKICDALELLRPQANGRSTGKVIKEVETAYWLAANRYQFLAEVVFPLQDARNKMKKGA